MNRVINMSNPGRIIRHKIFYKALNPDMTSYFKFKYEINKLYKINGHLEMCKNGFHVCENLEDCFNYYSFNNCRLFMANISSNHINDGKKIVSDKIILLREILDPELQMTNPFLFNSANQRMYPTILIEKYLKQ